MPLSRPPIRPRNQLPSGVGAESMGLRSYPDTAQIQSIGVPTSLQGQVTVRIAVGVQPAGLEEQLESRVVEVDQAPPQRRGELGSAKSVAIVANFVDPPGVMEQGEERDDLWVGTCDLGNPKAVLKHPRPVNHPMVAAYVKRVALQNHLHDGSMVVHGWALVP